MVASVTRGIGAVFCLTCSYVSWTTVPLSLDPCTLAHVEPPLDTEWPYNMTMGFNGKPPVYTGKFAVNSGGMWWPKGTSHFGNGALAEHLHSAARWQARRAITLFTSLDAFEQLDAAIATGVAYELMLKAHLADIAYSLLARRGDRDSLLMLAGKGVLTKAQGTDFKSVEIEDAAGAARTLTPSLPIPQQGRSLAMKVRNSACHMGLVEARELRRAVVEMARVVDGILKVDEADREHFWGSATLAVVDALIDEAEDAIKQALLAKIAAARTRVLVLTAGLEPATRQIVLAAVTRRRPSFGEYVREWKCPACEQQGDLLCDIAQERKIDVDDEGQTYPLPLQAIPYAFECGVCQLHLNDDEVQQSGDFPEYVELRLDEDPDLEPDEDYERDR